MSKSEEPQKQGAKEEKTGYNRRDFLKIVGAGTGVVAAGCAREMPEKLIPYVVQPDEVIPGIASWYKASCEECSAGCGFMVRTREGRVVKVEGNPAHPINSGGLCAIGQSSVQGLYDPDRIREPLKRDAQGVHRPISWKQAMEELAQVISASAREGKEIAVLSRPLRGSENALLAEVAKKIPTTKVFDYELLSRDLFDLSIARSFGAEYKADLDFSKAQTILGVGADYLETWLSPVAFTKGFAAGRRPKQAKQDKSASISKVYHIEPRLSLTAANADHWMANTPGSEHQILQAVLNEVIALDNSRRIDASMRASVAAMLRGSSTEELLKDSGLSKDKIQQLAKELLAAPASLVVAGGTASSGGQAQRCAALANILNAVLGNIGKTVLLYRRTTPLAKNKNSFEEVWSYAQQHIGKENYSGKGLGVVLVSRCNPMYALGEQCGVAKALAKAPMLVCHSTHLDETARLAHLVLPASTSFEAWGDSEPLPGVYNLNQPSMQPLYQSVSLGDLLISLLAQEKINAAIADVATYEEFIKQQWKKRVGELNFAKRWLQFVEAGGDWSNRAQPVGAVALSSKASNLPEVEVSRREGLKVLTFPTVHFGDGTMVNRPWLQEIPDPMTTAVWDSWIEVHPETAKAQGLAHTKVAQLRTPFGAVEAPVYVTPHIERNTIAIPLGQGHESYGRYSNGIGAQALQLLPGCPSVGERQFITAGGSITPSPSGGQLVLAQGGSSQLRSGVVRSVAVSALGAAHNGHTQHAAGHGGGHHDPHALGPQAEPKQMYKQMDHPLYRWGMSVDLASCTGCSACVTACYAENNIPVVGRDLFYEGREMAWLRIERYLDGPEEAPVKGFAPMMCQHCGNAPCEPVCPVYATYHSDQGLNTMVYNRCVGTRYCSNNCSYKVRRFNWFRYQPPEPLNWQYNPDVTVRELGVMEKCTFCIQRIREGENNAKDLGRPVQDGEIKPACAASCPADAIKFGNLKDPSSQVAKDSRNERSYRVLNTELNTQPAVYYLAKVTHIAQPTHGAGHAGSKEQSDAGHGQHLSSGSEGGEHGHK